MGRSKGPRRSSTYNEPHQRKLIPTPGSPGPPPFREKGLVETSSETRCSDTPSATGPANFIMGLCIKGYWMRLYKSVHRSNVSCYKGQQDVAKQPHRRGSSRAYDGRPKLTTELVLVYVARIQARLRMSIFGISLRTLLHLHAAVCSHRQ